MVYPFLEFHPDGGWETFQAAGVSGIPAADPTIPETGEAVHVKLYEGAVAVDGAGTAGVIDDPPVVPVGPGGMGVETGFDVVVVKPPVV